MIVSLRRAVVPFPVVASASVTLVLASARAQTYMDPIPYLSRADSPLLLTKPALEDFEVGLLNLLGTSASTGGVIGPGSLTDSVDGDDEVIDGSGTNGNSFFELNGTSGITFTFDPWAIGGFPSSAGLVWTDGGFFCNVYFEAFDASGVSLGEIGPYAYGDGSNNGTTAEVRFFGIVTQFTANDTLDFTVAGGKTGQLVLTAVVGVNGAPVFVPVFWAIFDNAGQIEARANVPSGLAGIVIDPAGVGVAASGAIKFSNELALTFY